MESTIKSVQTVAQIIFSNGQEYTIPFKNQQSQLLDLQNFGTKCSLKETLYKGTNTNVIGNICSKSLSIEGRSLDKKLISSNENSPYYNYMNNTAKIQVRCTGSDGVTTSMGTYYVDTWECGTSSSEYDTFYITCVDLLAKIKNISLHKVRINQHMKFSDYLKKVIDTLNRYLPNDLRVNYSIQTLQKLDNLYSSDWQMFYNNIDRDNIETIFNTLAQNTLSYIWIDRTNTLQVDSLLDDNSSEAVCSISGLTNLLEYNIEQGDIGNYSGISVEYIESVSYNDKQLLKLDNYQLYGGINEITAQLNSSKAINISVIEINCEDGTKAVCTGFFNYKNEIDMTIRATSNTIAQILVYGQEIEETLNILEKYKDDNKKDTVLEINNHLLRSYDIQTYADNFLRLISMKNSKLSVTGWINPQVKLSDMIGMTGIRLGINNYYKVVGLEFSLGTNYRCKADLMKTIEGQVAIESLLEPDNTEVCLITGGTIDTNYTFFNPTADEEEQIDDYIGTEIAALQTFI